jgi:hypothetical protein
MAGNVCTVSTSDGNWPVFYALFIGAVGHLGLLQKTNLRQALIYIHFHTEDRILPQIVENFSHFGHAYAGSTVLVGPES